jgi:CRP-like cAMP-binding protein
MGPGDFFGEIAFLTKAPRTATVRAETDMELLVLSPRHLEQIFDREPTVAVQMLASVAHRVRTDPTSH